MSQTLLEKYKQLFKCRIRQGLTPLEALKTFDSEELSEALCQESNTATPGYLKDKSSLLSYISRAGREERNEHDMGKAIELWLSGWTSETPHSTQTDVMSWYWRRQPKVKGNLGRKYQSTNQAYIALLKERGQ